MDIKNIFETNEHELLTLEVFNPTASIEITLCAAPRLKDLNGKIIGEKAVGYRAEETFPALRNLIKTQFPHSEIKRYDNFYTGKVLNEIPQCVEEIKQAGCNAVVIGNGG